MSVAPIIQLGRLASLGDLAALLTSGRTLAGRVTERHGDHGLLVLGGHVLVAKLPADIEAGARLQLRVAERAGPHVTLEVLGTDPASVATSAATVIAPSAATIALPGGARLQVLDEGAPGGHDASDGGQSVTLRLATASLGRLDLRVSADAVTISIADGPPAQLARAAAPQLRAALDGTPVTVQPRGASVDARA